MAWALGEKKKAQHCENKILPQSSAPGERMRERKQTTCDMLVMFLSALLEGAQTLVMRVIQEPIWNRWVHTQHVGEYI